MDPIARRECIVLGLAVLLFVSLLLPALLHARREARDGVRRNEMAAFKNVLEQYYNVHETYPLTFDASPHRYVVVTSDEKGATAWYLQARLENKKASHADQSQEEGANFNYRIVREGDFTYYEVCGGTPTCSLPRELPTP
jgi:hypothetical protein